MKLSIIIPVYNVEKTLFDCVNSAHISSYDDWEIILIDDGSTDSSGEMCNQLAVQDKHIKVIHQENKGLSEARNCGIDKAKGDYLAFLDSDDMLQPGTLEHMTYLLDKHPNYDIVEFPVKVYCNGPRERELKFNSSEYSSNDYWIESKAYKHAYAWNKVYRRRLFYAVRFPRGRIFEDVFTLPFLLKEAKIVATTPEGLYYYNDSPDGITRTADGKGLSDLLDAYMQIFHKFPNLLERKNIEPFYAHVLNVQLDVYELTGSEPKLPTMPFKSNTKLRLLQMIGMKNLCRCNKLLHKIVKPSR